LLDIWGYSSIEELEAVPREQRYTPQSYKEHIERLAKRSRGEPAPTTYEISIVRSDGQIRHLSVSRGELLWNGEKQFQLVYQDITERKQVQEALRRSEENYRDSIEKSPLGIRVLDSDGKKTLYANRALLDIWGYSSIEEMEAVPREQRYTPESWVAHIELMEKRSRGEPTPPDYERSIVRSDGQVRHVSVSLRDLLWGGKECFQVLYQDVTERKRAEEALRRSEENYRDSIEKSPLGIRVLDRESIKTLYANRALLDIWGYSSVEELVAVPEEQRYTPESYAEHLERLAKRKRGEPVPLVYELSIVRSDGQARHVSVSRGELLWNGEKQFQLVYQDITERKQAEVELALRSQLLDSATDSIIVHDFEGNFIYVNETACRVHGYSREEFMKLKLQDIVAQERVRHLGSAFQEMGKGGAVIESGHRRKDGSLIPVEVHGRPIEVGGRRLLLVVVRDITQRKRAQEALVKSEERYRTILAEIQEAYYEVDLAGSFTFVNDATCRIWGYSREELIGMNYKVYVPKEEVKGVYKAWNKVYRTGRSLRSYPFTIIRKDKKQIFLEASVTPLRNKEGKIIAFRSISRDVTEHKEFERKLAEMATHDALTGLPNRTLLSDRFIVALALSRRSRSKLAVLMLDLDRFKAVNDSMGHDVGDKLLKAVGKRLKATVRKSDTVARIGGDEFVLLLPQIPHEEEAAKFSQRILDAFREPFVFDDQRINITTSIGIAIYPEGGKDLESLLKSADTAMYWAKEQGRDIYRLYDGSEAATLLAKRRTTAGV
jgi:diguanylate cyclase (GGDEF)-like protein/PAS domain S-box-containing protein